MGIKHNESVSKRSKHCDCHRNRWPLITSGRDGKVNNNFSNSFNSSKFLSRSIHSFISKELQAVLFHVHNPMVIHARFLIFQSFSHLGVLIWKIWERFSGVICAPVWTINLLLLKAIWVVHWGVSLSNPSTILCNRLKCQSECFESIPDSEAVSSSRRRQLIYLDIKIATRRSPEREAITCQGTTYPISLICMSTHKASAARCLCEHQAWSSQPAILALPWSPLRGLTLSMLLTWSTTSYQTTCTVSERSSIKGTCQCKPTWSSFFALRHTGSVFLTTNVSMNWSTNILAAGQLNEEIWCFHFPRTLLCVSTLSLSIDKNYRKKYNVNQKLLSFRTKSKRTLSSPPGLRQ